MCRWGVLRGVARAGEDEVYTNSYVMQVEIIWRVEASVGGGGFKCFLHPPPLSSLFVHLGTGGGVELCTT